MIKIYSKSKKHKFVTKDGNKLGKRKIGDFKNSLWFKEATKNLSVGAYMFLNSIPKEEMLSAMGTALKYHNDNMDIINKKSTLSFADKLYVIDAYLALNKVADILGDSSWFSYDNTYSPGIEEYYLHLTKNMLSIQIEHFNNAIEFDYNNYLKYRKHYEKS